MSERTGAERVTLVISILILVAIVSLAFWANYKVSEDPPLVSAEPHLDQVRTTPHGFYVPITITNTGGRTAQDVVITGELVTGEGEPETGDVTISFLAGGESEHAELIFSTNPADGELTVRATSYLEP